MSDKYSEVLDVHQVIGKNNLPRMEVTYNNEVISSLTGFIKKHNIVEGLYIGLRHLNYPSNICLLYLLGDLRSIDKDLYKAIERKFNPNRGGYLINKQRDFSQE